jgi:hypothetical protein
MYASRLMVQLALRWRVCRVFRDEQATKRHLQGNAPPLPTAVFKRMYSHRAHREHREIIHALCALCVLCG